MGLTRQARERLADAPPMLASFKDAHRGESVVVCGCGESLNLLEHPERFVTIGVNDVGRCFTPDYLVVVNPRSQFSGDRFRYVEGSNAKYLFTQFGDLGVAHPDVVRIELGSYGGTDFTDPRVLHFTQNSPYVALCLAVRMGARRIGLIGVDFTEHHFFARTGVHTLASRFGAIDREYGRLAEACKALGVEVFNLSPVSRLTAFPRMSVEEFALDAGMRGQGHVDADALKIVSYATTPVAGVPAILARCIAGATRHAARCVWATSAYGNGVSFAGDVEWTRAGPEAESLLAEADLVIVHNGKVDPLHRRLLAGKPVITMAHNYLWNVDTGFVAQGLPGIVVGQYQATLPEFAGWTPIPNPIPLWEPAFQPGDKGAAITVCYTPSGKHERYPDGHRLYWHAKGYDTTMRALDLLAARFSVRLATVRDGQCSHAESLEMKRRAHIVIDECATGSYHRNSLEGLAAGCVVVNGIGLLPGIETVLRHCAGEGCDVPFERADLESLPDVLAGLVESGADRLRERGAAGRRWMEEHWDFKRQWERFWIPAVERALRASGRKGIAMAPTSTAQAAAAVAEPAAESSREVSVIIPQGGHERLPLLAAMLANLRQNADASQVIVAETGVAPLARPLARRWGADYVFSRDDGAFNKSRTINLGCSLARHDLLLWCDNDLLIPAGFISRAATEMHAGGYDLFFPYSRIDYLGEPDTREVLRGTKNPAECAVVTSLEAVRRAIGGALLVRREFVSRYGGMCEEFRGWGGEDNAWVHKVSILGRRGVTASRDQVAYHMYHADSGALKGQPAKHPDYDGNVALWSAVQKISSAHAYLERFPPPAHFAPPWQRDARIAFTVSPEAPEELADLAHSWDDGLRSTFGVEVSMSADPAPDAAVTFGLGVALAHLRSHPTVARQVVVLESEARITSEDAKLLKRADWIVAADGHAIAALERLGLNPWHLPWRNSSAQAGRGAPLVAGPLSVVLGARAAPARARASDELPVWMYWEGECPEWIRKCQGTARRHAPGVRILDRCAFDALWDGDRDIDIERLQVAHRADFIRAFLLARYGGLWIDADCIVMKPLEPTLRYLEDHDFVAHRERQGYFSNAFMAARPGSEVASAFYAAVCRTLRSGRPLGWISIGNELLSAILGSTGARWREIDTQLVQPICWSRPEAFFERSGAAEHAARVDSRAQCYMLSNQNVQRFRVAHPGRDLMEDGTFFRHLIDTASRERDEGNEAIATGISPAIATLHIPFFLAAMADIRPQRVLEIGAGSGRWAVLLREIDPAAKPSLDAITVGPVGDRRALKLLYDRVRSCAPDDLPECLEGTRDLIVLGEGLRGLPKAASAALIERALDISGYVLVALDLDDWTLEEGLDLGAVRHALFPSPGGAGYGAFVLSRHDARALRRPIGMQATFDSMCRDHLELGMESCSGPGSSLAQTREIRQRLPQLLQDIRASSLLDVPCGDFHWMRHVALGVDRYIGVDVHGGLVRRNREQFGNARRTFLQLDITADALPRADVIFCRDCLVHFSYRDAMAALEAFRRSGSRYLLTTTFPARKSNWDIENGDWRPLNLELAPFRFPPPLRLVTEKCTEGQGRFADKSLGLWRLDEA